MIGGVTIRHVTRQVVTSHRRVTWLIYGGQCTATARLRHQSSSEVGVAARGCTRPRRRQLYNGSATTSPTNRRSIRRRDAAEDTTALDCTDEYRFMTAASMKR